MATEPQVPEQAVSIEAQRAEQLAWLEQQLAPQENPEQGRVRRTLEAAVIAGGVVAGAVVANKTGILDQKITPHSPVFEQITTGIIAGNDAIRTAAPYALAAGVATQLVEWRRAKKSLRDKQMLSYSRHDYSGLESATAENQKSSLRRKVATWTAGLLLAGSAATFITGSAAVEQEVSNGPTRAVKHLVDELGVPGQPTTFIASSENAHFMNRSYVHTSSLQKIENQARQNGQNITVNTFSEDLSSITYPDGSTTTGLLIGMPREKLFGEHAYSAGMTCEDKIPVVADSALDAEVGDELELDGGITTKVVGVTSESSSMNRAGLLMDRDAVLACYEKQVGVEDPTTFGAVVSGADAETMNRIIEQAGVRDDAVAMSRDRLIQNNEKFWRANGTPILLQQILYLGGFAGVAIAGARLTALQQNTRELGAMLGLGIKERELKVIESMRGLATAIKATVIAAPAAVGLAAALNATERGLEVGVSARDALVAFTVLAASSIFGARRGVKKFIKNTDPAEATAR